ncbi:MAG: gamma-glutamyl-gamma-aminobutyrate hydrolase family protein [Thermincolia bacterium]
MRPVIGITCAHDNDLDRAYINQFYVRAVEKAGGIPILLPIVGEGACLNQMVHMVDGLLFSGGADLDPVCFGQEPMNRLGEITPERDFFELELARQALGADLAILAICRGIQLINIAAGGTVYQDVNSQVSHAIKHYQKAPRWYPTHRMSIKPGSQLASILQTKDVRVNSFHHQAVADVASGFKVTAVAADGVIEAIESENHKFVVGIQCHPECMWEKDETFLRVFKCFVEAGK